MKCIAVEEPTDSDNFLLFRADAALTVTDVECLTESATSVVVAVEECDANGGSCEATDVASGACGTTNTSLTVTNADVQSGDWLRLDIGTVSGSPGHVTVCLSADQ
ncbi:MAG: hypothetical protein ACR2N6_00230 [Miltoncostaeaceae bacterium]